MTMTVTMTCDHCGANFTEDSRDFVMRPEWVDLNIGKEAFAGKGVNLLHWDFCSGGCLALWIDANTVLPGPVIVPEDTEEDPPAYILSESHDHPHDHPHEVPAFQPSPKASNPPS